ncbi:hypothetical protein HK102_004639 [Quaeritorhiza haematococci]|nr:hypothetical protein HK102_004639 [Quaeritorhiza haematococci]
MMKLAYIICILAGITSVVASPLPNELEALDITDVSNTTPSGSILNRRQLSNRHPDFLKGRCGVDLKRPCRENCAFVQGREVCEESCFGGQARFHSFNDICIEPDIITNKRLRMTERSNFQNLPDITYVDFPAPNDTSNPLVIPRLSRRTTAILGAPGALNGVCYTGVMVMSANVRMIYMWPLVPRGTDSCQIYTATNVVQPYQVPDVDATGHDFIFKKAQEESGASNVPRNRVLGFALQTRPVTDLRPNEIVLDLTSGTFNCGRGETARTSVPNPTCVRTATSSRGERLMGRQSACMLFNVLLARLQLTATTGRLSGMFEQCNEAYPWFVNDRNV